VGGFRMKEPAGPALLGRPSTCRCGATPGARDTAPPRKARYWPSWS
jgi:hypothetical protein